MPKPIQMTSKDAATLYTSKEWRIATTVVRQRDKNLCACCGFSTRTMPHRVAHILSPVDCPSLATDPDNLVLVCLYCHPRLVEQGRIAFALGTETPKGKPHALIPADQAPPALTAAVVA